MAAAAGVEDEGDEHGVVDRRDMDAVPLQNDDVVLDVLADLEDGFVFEERLERGQRVGERDLIGRCAAKKIIALGADMGEGDVAGLAAFV